MKYIVICLGLLCLISCSTTSNYYEGCINMMNGLYGDFNVKPINQQDIKDYCETRQERWMKRK